MKKSSEAKKLDKTAIIYCRATNKRDAKRQQAIAEAKAKELNAVVMAIFVDIIPAQRQTILRQISSFFRNNQPKKAIRRKEWPKAITHLQTNKTDYAITQSADRLSRNFVEYRAIENEVNGFGTKIVLCDFEQTEI